MDQSENPRINYSSSFGRKLKEKLYRLMRITSRPVVRVYNGYGNPNELVVFGHVLSTSPLPRKKFRRNVWTNTLALIRLFVVKPMPMVSVELHFNGAVVHATSGTDGFFRFQWKPVDMPVPGWHKVSVFLAPGTIKNYYEQVSGEGEICVPHAGQYAVISDIDDTFLISHSSNLFRRLYVLLTENAYTRKPFEGVVRHYQALELAGKTTCPNPFFYVSSSEWNLYDYIKDFSRKNILPRGVYLLNQMKSFSEAWKTGQNNHSTKFMRISRILQAFPERQFILLGDDSQQDPVIYASVGEHFPTQVKAVYLRNVYHKNTSIVQSSIKKLEAAGIPVCHFQHSRDALAHSRAIGLID